MSVTHKRIQTERKLETKSFVIYHARHDVLPVVFSWHKLDFHFTVHAYTKNMFSAHRNSRNVWASHDNANDSETHWPTMTMTDISTTSHKSCLTRLHRHTAMIGMVQHQWKRFHCNRNARTFFRVVSVKVNVTGLPSLAANFAPRFFCGDHSNFITQERWSVSFSNQGDHCKRQIRPVHLWQKSETATMWTKTSGENIKGPKQQLHM